MKITRHTAPDMRQALKAVREQLGPDAVILSSKRTAEGVEVTAAMDFDAESLAAACEPPAPAATAPGPHTPAASSLAAGANSASAAGPAAAPAAAASALDSAAREMGDGHPVLAMESELKTLRRVLETQLARLAWNDLARRAPIHTEMLRELTEVGISSDLAAEVVGNIPPGAELTHARRLAIATIAQRVLVTGDRWLQEGGRVALVGPTGVGKSTTLAKLAVRWVLNHGPRDLALVAADCQRFGAQSELQSLGQLLGAPVYPLEE